MTPIKFLMQFIFIFINECLVYSFVLNSYGNKTKLNIKTFMIIFITSLLVSLNSAFSIAEIRLIGNYVLGILMFYAIDSSNIKKSIFYFSVLILYGLLIEIIISLILPLFIGSIKDLNYYFQPIIALLSYVVWFGSWRFILKNNKVKYLLNKIEESISKVLKLEIILILMLFVTGIIIATHYRRLQDNIFFIGAIININLLFGLIFLVLKNKIKLKYLEISNLHLKNNIDIYESILNDHKIIKHNLISDLMAIRTLSDERVKTIIDIKIKQYNKDYLWINNVNKVPDGIKGLVCMKIAEAKRLGINIILESSKFKNKNIYECMSPKTYLSLCEAMDILINNSIEAAADSQNKSIRLSIAEVDKKIYINIINCFVNEVNISKFGCQNYSTKKRNSGIGVFSTNSLKKDKINLSFKIINDVFITTIVVNLKK